MALLRDERATHLMDDTLAKLPRAFSGATVLVLGDVMLDRFVYGAVERISPEAPVPVIGRASCRERVYGTV